MIVSKQKSDVYLIKLIKNKHNTGPVVTKKRVCVQVRFTPLCADILLCMPSGQTVSRLGPVHRVLYR